MGASQRPEGPVSFSTLSSTARIINVSPAWPSVAQALTYLRGTPPPLPGPEYDVAVQTVHEFAQLLRRNGDSIAAALLCGAMLGRLTAARTPATALRTGLMTISEAYRFSLRSEKEIHQTLIQLLEQLPPRLGLKSIPLPRSLAGDDQAPWIADLGAAIEYICDQVIIPVGDVTYMVEPHLTRRLERFIRGEPVVDPELDEVIAHAAGEVNSEFLRWDLGRMTALQWSRIVAAWLQPEHAERRPAPWLLLAAFAALGFVAEDPVGTAMWLNPDDPSPTMQGEFPPFRRRGPRAERGVLVVRDTKRTIAERWLPTPEVAALVLPPEPAARLLDRLASGEPPIGPELRLVAIEGVEGAGRLAGFLPTASRKDPFGALRGRFEFAHILPSEVEADPFALLGPVIVRPRGFKDLVERMEARVPQGVAQAARTK